jgi:ankyrin repeat protein
MKEEFSSLTPTTPRRILVSTFSGYPEHMAVVNNDIDALVNDASSCDLNCQHHDDNKATPLTLAIVLHRATIVQHLIDCGVDVNWRSERRDWTPALVAARHGSAEIMRILMRANADITAKRHEDTMAHFAALNSDAAVLAMLIDAGVPLNRKNWHGEPPIFNAATNSNEQVMAMLLPQCGASILTRRFGSATIAHVAAANPNENVLAMLIAAGAKLTQVDSRKMCPIHVAARNPNPAVVRLLINAGVNVNALDGNGRNSLFKACLNPNEEVLDALLAAGAEWRDCDFQRVCDAVAENQNLVIARRLLEPVGDLSMIRDRYNRTLLHSAAGFGSSAVVEFLLRAGVDVAVVDTHGWTAYDMALTNRDKRVMRLLLAAGVPQCQNKLIEGALKHSHVDALIDAGVGVIESVSAMWKLERILFESGDALASLFARGADLHGATGRTRINSVRTEALLTLVAAGVDVSHHCGTNGDVIVALLAAGGHVLSRGMVSTRQLAWAHNRIDEQRFELLRLRAFQVCVGLQSVRLPALVTCEILAHAFAPLESLVAFHRVWAVVTTIKHWRERLKQ